MEALEEAPAAPAAMAALAATAAMAHLVAEETREVAPAGATVTAP